MEKSNLKRLINNRASVFFSLLLVLGFLILSAISNIDSLQPYSLYMDERISFEGVQKILYPEDLKQWLWAISDGGDQRYGRSFWNVASVVSWLPEKMFGSAGQIFATRMLQSILLAISYCLLVWTFINKPLVQLLALAALIVLPFTPYYSTMPKPEPLMLLFLTLFFILLKKNQYNNGYWFIFLGLALGTKVSSFTLLPVLGIFLLFLWTKEVNKKQTDAPKIKATNKVLRWFSQTKKHKFIAIIAISAIVFTGSLTKNIYFFLSQHHGAEKVELSLQGENLNSIKVVKVDPKGNIVDRGFVIDRIVFTDEFFQSLIVIADTSFIDLDSSLKLKIGESVWEGTLEGSSVWEKVDKSQFQIPDSLVSETGEYYRVRPDVKLASSIFPLLNNVLNWRGDSYFALELLKGLVVDLGIVFLVLILVYVWLVLPEKLKVKYQKLTLIFSLVSKVLKAGLWTMVGFLLAVPILLRFPVDAHVLSQYLAGTFLNTGHGSDNSQVNFLTWLKLLFAGQDSVTGLSQPLSAITIFTITTTSACILLFLVFFIRTKFFSSQSDNQTLDRNALLFCLVSLSLIVPILFFTKRFWVFYLHIGLVFGILGVCMFLSNILQSKSFALVKFLNFRMVLILGVALVGCTLFDSTKILQDFNDLANRSKTLEFQKSMDDRNYITSKITNLLQSASKENPVVIEWDPNLFELESYPNVKVNKFWGPFLDWASLPNIIVGYDNVFGLKPIDKSSVQYPEISKALDLYKQNVGTDDAKKYKILDHRGDLYIIVKNLN